MKKNKVKPKIIVRQSPLVTLFDSFFMVVEQEGTRPNDDRDAIVALCYSKADATRVQKALRDTTR